MATPPPVPPPVDPPEIFGAHAPDYSSISFLGLTNADLDQLSAADNGTVVYNAQEGRLQVKTVGGWANAIIPHSVTAAALQFFLNDLSSGLNRLYDLRSRMFWIESSGGGYYKDTINYVKHARVIGSDGKVYKALASNGPSYTVQDPVTETNDPRTVWELDSPEPSYEGVAIAGGHVHSDGTLVTGESWGVSSVTKSGTDSDSYLYTVILDVPVDDNEYYVQAHSIVDVTDVTIIPIIPSDPPCFTAQFEKRVNANTIHEGIARAFYFVVYGK